jgi:hypothetical protein
MNQINNVANIVTESDVFFPICKNYCMFATGPTYANNSTFCSLLTDNQDICWLCACHNYLTAQASSQRYFF